ncbi:MAG: mechanosensitive ion channel protein MscS [Rhodobacterales bacterium]|nr:MAG: mechanosensitive ion channel protein MscS [Rhodobacterales bacterium]
MRLRAALLALALGLCGSVALSQVAIDDAGSAGAASQTEERSPAEALQQELAPETGLGGWAALADRAETRIQSENPSAFSLRQLRAELATRRDEFLTAQNENAGRISTVKAQIEALGPVPNEGQDDIPLIQARREALRDELARLEAPALLARERYTEANGLIAEIDAITRDRQASHVTTRGLSPLNPVNWAPAIMALLHETRVLVEDLSESMSNSARIGAAISNLPLIMGLLAAAVLLLWRGRAWIKGLQDRVGLRGRAVWRFLLSLGLIVLPFLGLVLVTESIIALNMLSWRGETMVGVLPVLAILVLMAHWLAGHFFDPSDPGPLDLDSARAARGRWVLPAMAWIMALRSWGALLMSGGSLEAPDAALTGVILFPADFVAAWLLFLLGGILRLPRDPADDDDAPPIPYLRRLAGWMGQAARIVALAGAALALLGYARGAQALIYPAITTLAVLGSVILLQRFLIDLHAYLTRSEDASEREALIPVLGGFALALLVLPLLALIWGARVADLTELWARFREGFTIGQTTISPSDFITFAIVFGAGYTLTRLIQGTLASTVLPRTSLDKGGQNAIVSGLGYIGIFIAALAAITLAGIDLSSLAIVAGALSVGIGFGLQNVVSNFVSGIILLIERPISEGDWIEVGGQMGIVQSISVRSTRIQTFDRTDVIVPNADLVSGVVTNWTRGNSVGRVIVPVGVAYGTDTRRVEQILREVAESNPMVLMRPEPSILFQGFGDNSLDFEIRAILRDVNWGLSVGSEMRHEIAKRFAEEGIEIPFPQRDIWIRSSETGSDTPLDTPLAPSSTPARPSAPIEPVSSSEVAGGDQD